MGYAAAKTLEEVCVAHVRVHVRTAMVAARFQALLGISTLMMYVPVHLGVTHQVR